MRNSTLSQVVETKADFWKKILFYLFTNNSRNPLKKTFKTQIDFLSEYEQVSDEKNTWVFLSLTTQN
jgi:hypothetical protein